MQTIKSYWFWEVVLSRIEPIDLFLGDLLMYNIVMAYVIPLVTVSFVARKKK